ncbi:hypothetical protein [Terrabacter sp. 2YAF2]|uniref:hypothetical protein n=1 Tax=Terrabacter sp. 2YAF2 TaxID=3233026 RepID=UPI003F97BEFB
MGTGVWPTIAFPLFAIVLGSTNIFRRHTLADRAERMSATPLAHATWVRFATITGTFLIVAGVVGLVWVLLR